MKESLHDIGKAIQRHIEKEKASYTRIPAIEHRSDGSFCVLRFASQKEKSKKI